MIKRHMDNGMPSVSISTIEPGAAFHGKIVECWETGERDFCCPWTGQRYDLVTVTFTDGSEEVFNLLRK